jgi:catechol 2,3-dioxygenase-like lactoylglutathione lyase family enzyme
VSLQHVSLETRPEDVASEVRFWGLLGFAAVRPPGTLGERSAWLQAGATQIHLLFSDEPVVPPSGHVAVVSDDYAATTGALRAAGFAVDERARHWGAPRCFTRSPGGHRVEVMAPPPGAARAT